jgi:hypothetical protein
MKFKRRAFIIAAIVAGVAYLEFLNFMSGTQSKKIDIPNRSEQLNIVTDGFQDRNSKVYLSRRLWFPKFLFGFDPYGGGIYSFDVSNDGRIVRFNQSNETLYVRIEDAVADSIAPTGNVSYRTLVAPTTGEDVTGTYVTGIQGLFYR